MSVLSSSAMGAPFTSLFHFLDEFENYNRISPGAKFQRHGGISHVTPKFDVCELDDAYELHGELPGMNKKDLHIEFADSQVLLIRGVIQRSYTAGTPPEGYLFLESPSKGGSIAEGEHEQGGTEEKGKESTEQVSSKTTKAEKGGGSKYWLSERSVGEFSRTFNFAHKVDQDRVSAGLKDGILSVHIPKADKPTGRRIEVS